jgi:hypothetical protein
MAQGPENTFIGSVHRHLPVDLYHMKNHNEYNGGIADVWYSGTKADLWAEYKFIAVPKRDATVIDLVNGKNPAISYLQQDWLGRRHDEGRQVGVIVGSKDGGVWFPGISWACTYDAHFFRSNLLPRKDLARLLAKLTLV